MNASACLGNYPIVNKSWCPTVHDGYLCWNSTQPDTNRTLQCPKGQVNAYAHKYCDKDGKWETSNLTNASHGYTNYNECLMPQFINLVKMCNRFENGTCEQIAKITRCIEMVGLTLSLVTLIISLFIFFQYRVLKNNRTTIHKNLFIATILHVIIRLMVYIDQGFEKQIISTNEYVNQICITILEYTKTAMFMWMFIEGLYLHNMITVTVFQEYRYIKIYFYFGWITPALMTAVWLIVMKVKEQTWEHYYFHSYYWILEGPRHAFIVVNLLFLLNIIRVLIVKLNKHQTSEIAKVRKAVRAAIFLLPLLGISNIFFLVDYNVKEAWKFALWSYANYFMTRFQGFFVAVLYCFLNGEVQAAIKNSFHLRMSLRNYYYAPCRNVTLISTMPEAESHVDNGDGPKWIKCCNQMPQSPEEKVIEIKA